MMTDVINQLFTLPNLVLCLTIWVLVWVERKFVETAWKKAVSNKYWEGVVLPVLPLLTGGIIGGAASGYPFPADFKTLPARIFFGVVCGLVSAHAYRIVKQFLNNADSGDTAPTDKTDLID